MKRAEKSIAVLNRLNTNNGKNCFGIIPIVVVFFQNAREKLRFIGTISVMGYMNWHD
jgi:hypothetical protein